MDADIDGGWRWKSAGTGAGIGMLWTQIWTRIYLSTGRRQMGFAIWVMDQSAMEGKLVMLGSSGEKVTLQQHEGRFCTQLAVYREPVD